MDGGSSDGSLQLKGDWDGCFYWRGWKCAWVLNGMRKQKKGRILEKEEKLVGRMVGRKLGIQRQVEGLVSSKEISS